MSLPASITQPPGSTFAEEVDNGLADYDPATQLDYFTLDFITLAQMGATAFGDFTRNFLVQQAMNLVGIHIVYVARFELGPLQSFVIPGITIPIGDNTYTSPFAGQVIDGGWRNWLVGLAVPR